MSVYTTQVRWIVEMNKTSGTTIDEKIVSAIPSIFNFDFPIWDEQYRPILEKKILKHYYMWEIGLETVGLWKFYLNMKLNEIMPYYNQLYLTTVKDYDWLSDTNITETLERNENRNETNKFTSTQSNDTDTTDDTTSNATSDTSGTTKTTGSPTSHTMHNDFPQSPIETGQYATYEDYVQNVLSEDVVTEDTQTADSTVKNIRTTNQDIDTSSSNTLGEDKNANQTLIKKGASGVRSFTEMLMEYRESLINIDILIINELQDLFMSVW